MIKLYEHNKTAYEAALSLLRETGRAAVIHPTGSGKSFIGFKLCEDFPEKRICWLSPSEYIFRTQIENLKEAADGYAPENITFCTYAKLMQMSKEQIAELRSDYIILDEFHRCGARIWGQSVQTLLGLYPDVPVLGLSATAIRYLDNQRDMADELFDGNIASEMTLGEAIVRGILNPPKYITALYSFQKDLERYQERIGRLKNRSQRSQAERYLEALRRALEKADGLDVLFERHMADRHGKYIVFCANAEHMREMMEQSQHWFAKVDNAPHRYFVYSEDPDSRESFAGFKEDEDTEHLRLLFCIDALNEGIHVDDISGVILLRPTVSPIIYKQQIGRALSAGGSNVPVIFDIVNNIAGLYSISSLEEEMEEVLKYYQFLGEESYVVNTRFRVIDEVRDCRALFDALEHTLSASWEYMYAEARRYFEQNGDLLPAQGYVTENGCKLGQWIVTQRNLYRGTADSDRSADVQESLTLERIRKLEEIGMCWQTRQERFWEEGFALAEAYAKRHGNLNVSRAEQPKLFWWLLRQQQKYREGQLGGGQYRRLEALGMEWEPEDAWEKKISLAQEYFARNGNLDIPSAYVTEDGTALGMWCRGVRMQYREGKLSKDREERLEAIGMQWESVSARNWNQYYRAAEQYFEINGNLNVPAGYETEDGEKLGIWISGQRDSYKKGRLTEEQVRMLEKIGMSWQRYRSKWESACACAEDYSARYGGLNPAVSYVTDDGFALGAWVTAQRRKYSAGKLGKKQIERLNKLGIVWNPQDTAWQQGYAHAEAYRETNGHLHVPNNYIADDGYQLGVWLNNQRTRHKNGRMSQEQSELLEKLGFVWNVHAEKWNRGYSHARDYRKGGGSVPIPHGYVAMDGYPLGEWMRAQERKYRRGALESEKVDRLAEIGVVFGV